MPYRRLFKPYILLIGLSLTLAACSGPLKQVNISGTELYRAKNMDTDFLNSLGFLTTVVAGNGGLKEYRNIVSDLLERTFIKKVNPHILTSREALNLINQANLTGEYAKLIEQYEITGILDKRILRKLKDILKVKYIAQPRLSYFTERAYSRLTAFGLALVSTRETTVKISLQIWDAERGLILWEGSGEAIIAVEAMRAKHVTFEEVAAAACEGLIEKLKAGKKEENILTSFF